MEAHTLQSTAREQPDHYRPAESIHTRSTAEDCDRWRPPYEPATARLDRAAEKREAAATSKPAPDAPIPKNPSSQGGSILSPYRSQQPRSCGSDPPRLSPTPACGSSPYPTATHP